MDLDTAKRAGEIAAREVSLAQSVTNLQTAVDAATTDGVTFATVELTNGTTFRGLAELLSPEDAAELLEMTLNRVQAKLDAVRTARGAM